ncbi:hypothetical protein J0X14_04495 [Muricauda sp. CAU 1633]|uniref:ATP-binding protein n=1 Tax=Allomuricauda sp. CAU 1633 TaxID=2816036 RepID=UPI001A8F680D|nr:tetratricopeptide repeat-containing sensor histidine kinase [Muricauda sp. CAU 1633]MBO0321548.1 hypothetical protein [Muricauda sp. CAU 1633]
MKKFLILTFIGLSVCCTPSGKKPISRAADNIKDSVLHYYYQSLDKNLSLVQKQQKIDKSFFLAKNHLYDSIYSQILYQKNSLHLASQEYDSLQIYNKLLINHALKIGDDHMLAYQYYLMGYYFAERAHNSEEAFQNYTLSKGYFEQIGDSSGVGRNLLNMGTIQKDFNDFFGSKETLTEALQYLVPENDTVYIAQCYNLLATDHRKLLNYDDAIIYYLKAINTTNSIEDRLIYKNNLAATYIDDARYRQAVHLLDSIATESLIMKNGYEYARVLDNLAYASWLSRKEKAVDPFLQALEIRQQNNDKRGQIASYTHLGEFFSKNQHQKAQAYFDTVINLSKTIKMPRAEKDALKFLMHLEPTNFQLRDRYVFLQDSLYEQELKVKTQFAKYKYDDKLKQESILRLEKENAEKELEASRQRNQKIIYLGGFLFVISVLGLSIYSFGQRTKRLRQKNKTDKLMATHETEAELSRRLHDGFGAGLNQTMLMVQNDMDKSTLLDTLEGLYNQSRDFSREINEVNTGSKFREEFFEMLRFRTPLNAKLLITGSKEINWAEIAPLTKTVLYKVLQELMINMGKHSEATLITISLQKVDKMLKVDYIDDGVGASVEDLNAKNGLRNTEKRIQALGGTITFDSGKGDGFRANIILPK